jgi:hypothetical protein
MRWLRGNIGVDGHEYIEGFLGLDWCPSAQAKSNLQRYESLVEGVVAKITKTAVGHWIFWQINTASSKKVIIKPWLPSPDPSRVLENDIHNPYAAFDDPSKATRPDDLYWTDISPGSSTKSIWGKGGGSDVTVRFSSWYTSSDDKRPAYAPEELLLHELVHGMNGVKGRYTKVGHGAEKLFDTPDEFAAILFTNLFSSQLGGRTLRKDHSGHDVLDQDLQDSQKFYDRYKNAVEFIIADYPELTKIYAGWDAGFVPFNPFRFSSAAKA